MSDPYIQNLFADRIGGARYGKDTDIYKFEKIKRAKRQAIKDFPDRPLLDFGIGENDEMAHESVRAVMKEEIDKPENRGYADNGILEFKEAAAEYMKREYGVDLDPETEINHTIGSKHALALIPLAFINPGDVTLMTVPGYPVLGTRSKYLGGTVHPLPLLQENNFLPDLDSIPDDVKAKSKILVLNYPNSPTGGLATVEFFKNAIEFAHTNDLIIVHDAAHGLLSFGQDPMSFLSIDGAKEVGIETHSCSKGHNMIGWRIGFICGNSLIVRAVADVKDNCDSGQFIAIQKAAAAALRNPEIGTATREKYRRRMKKLVSTLGDAGFKAEMPGGTYFLYVPAPKGMKGGVEFENAEAVSQFLIRERSICTVPWDNAGEFLRFSTTYVAETEKDEDELMKTLLERISGDEFVW